MKCPKCNLTFDEGEEVCPKCGSGLVPDHWSERSEDFY